MRNVQKNEELKGSVLLVDDDPQLFLTLSLEERGYEVHSYTNSLEAARKINEGLFYNVAMFDLSIGKENDFNGDSGQNLAYLSSEKNPDVPIIIFSAYSLIKAPYAKRVIFKPTPIPNLIQIIEEVIKETRSK